MKKYVIITSYLCIVIYTEKFTTFNHILLVRVFQATVTGKA